MPALDRSMPRLFAGIVSCTLHRGARLVLVWSVAFALMGSVAAAEPCEGRELLQRLLPQFAESTVSNEDLLTLVESCPDDVEFHLMGLRETIRLFNPMPWARRHLEMILAAEGAEALPKVGKVFVAHRLPERAGALAGLTRWLVEQYPDSPEAYLPNAVVQHDLGRYRDACTSFNTYFQGNPQAPQALWFMWKTAAEQTQDTWESVKRQSTNEINGRVNAVRQRLDSRERQPNLMRHLELAYSHRGLGLWSEAVGYAREARQRFPFAIEAHYAVGELSRKAGDLFVEEAFYAEFLKKHPNWLPGHIFADDIKNQLGKIDEGHAIIRSYKGPDGQEPPLATAVELASITGQWPRVRELLAADSRTSESDPALPTRLQRIKEGLRAGLLSSDLDGVLATVRSADPALSDLGDVARLQAEGIALLAKGDEGEIIAFLRANRRQATDESLSFVEREVEEYLQAGIFRETANIIANMLVRTGFRDGGNLSRLFDLALRREAHEAVADFLERSIGRLQQQRANRRRPYVPPSELLLARSRLAYVSGEVDQALQTAQEGLELSSRTIDLPHWNLLLRLAQGLPLPPGAWGRYLRDLELAPSNMAALADGLAALDVGPENLEDLKTLQYHLLAFPTRKRWIEGLHTLSPKPQELVVKKPASMFERTSITSESTLINEPAMPWGLASYARRAYKADARPLARLAMGLAASRFCRDVDPEESMYKAFANIAVTNEDYLALAMISWVAGVSDPRPIHTCMMAEGLRLAGHPEEGLALLEEQAQGGVAAPFAYFQAALCAHDAGNLSRAREFLTQGLEAEPRDPTWTALLETLEGGMQPTPLRPLGDRQLPKHYPVRPPIDDYRLQAYAGDGNSASCNNCHVSPQRYTLPGSRTLPWPIFTWRVAAHVEGAEEQ